jgi:uncharacterized protein
MKDPEKCNSMTRRDFLKVSVAGVASAVSLGAPIGPLFASEEPHLTYRTLGRTGLKVTTVAFGAMLTPEYEVIRAGFDTGINYVDTARRYLGGRSEEIVSKALAGMRDKVFVATKTLASSNTKPEIFKDVETSLASLHTDHIDVIQLHNLSSPDRAFNPEVREAYLELRKQGKVRFFGVTTHTNQAEVVNAIVDDPTKFFDTVLVQYNFKSEPSVGQAITRAAKAGIGVIAMKTQAGGYKTEELGPVSPHQAALKWVLQNPSVTTTIPGMKTMAHIKEMTSVMGMKMAAQDTRILDIYGRAIDPYYCHLCSECEGSCPQGVAVSVVNRALMYAQGYGELSLARETFEGASNSFACSTCSGCVARCVRGVDIAAKMKDANRLLA